jgi:ribonuclease Z
MIDRTVDAKPRWSRSQLRGTLAFLVAGVLVALAGGTAVAGEPATGSADVMSNPGASWSTEPIGVYAPGTALAEDHMRITLLGTSFLPRIAQEANSVFVELGNGDSFVFDFGSGVSAKYGALGIPPSRQTNVFLTHLHGDHTSDLITLYCFGPSLDRKTPLHLYGPSGDSLDEGMTEWGATLKKLMKWHEESFSFLPTGTVDQGDGYDIITHELPYMETGVAYEEHGVTITHFPAVHARDGSISYKLEWNGLSMVFSGDTLPNQYVLQNAKGVDVLVHEMVVPPDIWAEKNSGLQPGDPGWDQALNVATAVQQSSHTPEQALGYILSQTQPRLGVATHFQVNSDTIEQAIDNVQSWYDGPFAIATDLFVIDVSKDAITLGQAVVPEYAWYPPQTPYPSDQLAAPKYDSPTAQLNDELLSNVIDPDIYDDPPE